MNAGVSGDMKMRPEAVGELPRPHKVAPQPFDVLTSLIGGFRTVIHFFFTCISFFGKYFSLFSLTEHLSSPGAEGGNVVAHLHCSHWGAFPG
jgi:hypothetical protein